MKAIALAAAALSLLAAAPAFARDKAGEERRHPDLFRISPEDFGPFEMHTRGTRLGVQISPMTEELRVAMGASRETGILVNRVLDDSPAKKAGVLVGDVIVEVAGEPIADVGDVWKALSGKDGDVKLEVIREKRHVNLTAKIEKNEQRVNAFGFAQDAELRREVEELRTKLQDLEQRLDRLEKK